MYIGQVYVGISRVRTLEGLLVSNYDERKVTADPAVLQFYSNLERYQTAHNTQLLVLDLNGVLFHKDPLIERPHLNDFLKYCFENFNVMVWSSGKPHTVERVINIFFGEHRKQLVATWARDKFGLTDEQYNSNYPTIKDLSKVWADFPKYGAHNTILIDDSPEKAEKQPNNLVCASTFVPKNINRDIELKHLMGHLAILRQKGNIAEYIKNHPYKSPDVLFKI
jgi:hypothetical protein